ncbi:MAG: hypothetical protein IKW83_03335 [Muribaculaceae bacterium]|nr:hypothetical protein [Muribaculaceae bacterium]
MTRKLLYRILLLALLCVPTMKSHAGNTIISVKLDSAKVMMGKTVKLYINIVQDESLTGIILDSNIDTLGDIEIVKRDKMQIKSIDNNREEITQTITLQPFEPGEYDLPPIKYFVDGDTVVSNQEHLVVEAMKVDVNGEIKDYKTIVDVPFKIVDYIPNVIANHWWAWLAGLAALALLIFAYFKWFKKGINPFKHEKKRLPPYEEAILALNNLKERQLWQNGQHKEYYSCLTDILRVYIDRRFGINAVEMTSSEIMEQIKHNEEALQVKDQLSEVLEIADYVKFAKMQTLANENEIAFERTLNFVEQTKPMPVEEEGKEESHSNAAGKEEKEQ